MTGRPVCFCMWSPEARRLALGFPGNPRPGRACRSERADDCPARVDAEALGMATRSLPGEMQPAMVLARRTDPFGHIPRPVPQQACKALQRPHAPDALPPDQS